MSRRSGRNEGEKGVAKAVKKGRRGSRVVRNALGSNRSRSRLSPMETSQQDANTKQAPIVVHGNAIAHVSAAELVGWIMTATR